MSCKFWIAMSLIKCEELTSTKPSHQIVQIMSYSNEDVISLVFTPLNMKDDNIFHILS